MQGWSFIKTQSSIWVLVLLVDKLFHYRYTICYSAPLLFCFMMKYNINNDMNIILWFPDVATPLTSTLMFSENSGILVKKVCIADLWKFVFPHGREQKQNVCIRNPLSHLPPKVAPGEAACFSPLEEHNLFLVLTFQSRVALKNCGIFFLLLFANFLLRSTGRCLEGLLPTTPNICHRNRLNLLNSNQSSLWQRMRLSKVQLPKTHRVTIFLENIAKAWKWLEIFIHTLKCQINRGS